MGIDYDRIASDYDRHRGGGGPYLKILVSLLRQGAGRRVLELGAGTGNNTQALQQAISCQITAIEPSRGMLEQARAKGIAAAWVRGRAEHLPFSDAAFDFVFATYVLHYIPDIEALFRECARVLQPGAYAAFVTAPHGYITGHPMNRYFPSYAPIDLARFQSVETIQAALRQSGFIETGAELSAAPPRPIDSSYLACVKGKYISTYELIPEAEYQAGLERLYADITANGRLDETISWQSVTVWGRRGDIDPA
jgi:SAM-dependent methyltransferase